MRRIRTRLALALLAAALIPLAASGVLVGVFMERTLAIGLNPSVEAELAHSLELAKRLHKTLKSQWELTLAELSLEDLRGGYPGVEAVALFDEAGGCFFIAPSMVIDPANCPRDLFEPVSEQPPLVPEAWDDPADLNRLWVWQRQFPDFLQATAVRIDGTHRARFEQARDRLQTYRRIGDLRGEILRASVGVYLGLLAVVALFAVVIGRRLAARVTRRLDDLLEGTERIGRGDWSWRVPAGGGDELGRLARSFNRMIGEIDQNRRRIVYLEKSGMWQDMARRLAHQIKNPLTPITLVTRQMHDAYRGDDAAYRTLLERGLSIVREETDSLKRLVDSFSAFARLPKAQPAPTDLTPFVTEQIGRYPEINERLEIRTEIEPNLPPALLDVALMKGVFYNLLENAAQAVHSPGRGRLTLTVRRNPHRSGRLQIRWADDGPGIAPELADRIFEPYFTTKADGSGLGLAVAKKILIEHGGDLTVEHRPGGGAVFIMDLPAVSDSPRS